MGDGSDAHREPDHILNALVWASKDPKEHAKRRGLQLQRSKQNHDNNKALWPKNSTHLKVKWLQDLFGNSVSTSCLKDSKSICLFPLPWESNMPL